MANKRLKTAAIEEEDPISYLPDSVLSHIISKLDTKSAVTTTLLSTRWYHLFSQIPDLKLSVHDSCFSNFISFMRYLISLHLPNVSRVPRFILNFDRHYPADEINAWLSALSTLKMLDFWFLCGDKNVAEMSSGIIFRSSSLQCLILGYVKFVNNISNSVFLPCLKTLCLINVTFSDGESLERVIAGCPVLNSLSISKCKIGSTVSVLRISSASVKDVKLCAMSYCCNADSYSMEFDMPALESLHFTDQVSDRYHLKKLSSAREAFIELGASLEQLKGEQEKVWRSLQNVRDFVETCSLVSSLHLSNMTVMALSCLSPLPSFPKMKELKLSEINYIGCELLPQFLESAPNLEVLVFKGGFSNYIGCFSNFQSEIWKLEHAPMCLASHLQTIKFEKFMGEEDEMGLVEYFLEHAQVLRKIEILFSCSVATEKLRSTKSQLWGMRSYSRKHQVDLEFNVEFDHRKILSLVMKKSEEMGKE